MKRRMIPMLLVLTLSLHPVLTYGETVTYTDEMEFIDAVQTAMSADMEELTGKTVDESLGSGAQVAQRARYIMEYLDEYRDAKYEDWRFQKLSDLFWGGGLVLSSSDIFYEGEPMNYALLDYGMRCYVTALEFMIEYYGLEIEDEARRTIDDLLDDTIEDYTMETDAPEEDAM